MISARTLHLRTWHKHGSEKEEDGVWKGRVRRQGALNMIICTIQGRSFVLPTLTGALKLFLILNFPLDDCAIIPHLSSRGNSNRSREAANQHTKSSTLIQAQGLTTTFKTTLPMHWGYVHARDAGWTGYSSHRITRSPTQLATSARFDMRTFILQWACTISVTATGLYGQAQACMQLCKAQHAALRRQQAAP